VERERRRHPRDHAADWKVVDLRVALAGTLHAGCYDGLLRDKARPPRIPPLGSDIAERVVALTGTDPPAEATHWTASMMAKAVGISASSVQRIWHAHGVQPHRVQQFKLSNDPKFIDKLRDVVGLYVFSVDEKAQIDALDRTQPGLPMKKDRACLTLWRDALASIGWAEGRQFLQPIRSPGSRTR
jgi:hypothetical protein